MIAPLPKMVKSYLTSTVPLNVPPAALKAAFIALSRIGAPLPSFPPLFCPPIPPSFSTHPAPLESDIDLDAAITTVMSEVRPRPCISFSLVNCNLY